MNTEPTSGYLVPRSAVLALWLPTLAVPSSAAVAEVVRRVAGDDEPHMVADGSSPQPDVPQTLTRLLQSWQGRVVAVTAALPVPGDVVGLSTEISAAATDAEECVLVTIESATPVEAVIHLALVPEITEFGSAWEPGHLVTWHVTEIPDWRLPTMGAVGTLKEAERALRETLRGATEALVTLDVARWSDSATSVSAGLAGFSALAADLPNDISPPRARLFTEAARLRFIIDGSTGDSGAAINLWQSDQRTAALKHVDRAARHAMMAACQSQSG